MDVLMVLNFIVNYLLLLISARLCAMDFSRFRLLLAALFGALCSLVIFLPPLGSAGSILFKSLTSGALVVIAGGYHGWRGFSKRLFMLLAASFVFAGFMLFITLMSGGKTGFFQNGVCYFHISGVKLVTCSVILYGILTVYQKLFKNSMVGEEEYQVLISSEGKTKEMAGVMDSQNHLIDLFSGTPVVIGSYAALYDILPSGICAAIDSSMIDAAEMKGVRFIPCRTVAGQDVLPAFRPERMILRHGEKEVMIEDVYIAVAQSLDTAGTQKLLLNPALNGRETQKNHKGGA